MKVTAQMANMLRGLSEAVCAERLARAKVQQAEEDHKHSRAKISQITDAVIAEVPDECGDWLVEELGKVYRIRKYKAGHGVNQVLQESLHRYGQ